MPKLSSLVLFLEIIPGEQLPGDPPLLLILSAILTSLAELDVFKAFCIWYLLRWALSRSLLSCTQARGSWYVIQTRFAVPVQWCRVGEQRGHSHPWCLLWQECWPPQWDGWCRVYPPSCFLGWCWCFTEANRRALVNSYIPDIIIMITQGWSQEDSKSINWVYQLLDLQLGLEGTSLVVAALG